MKVGILFNFSPKWMGGVIYIINLVNTLNFLDDKDKPEILLFHRKDLKRFIDEMKYPYLDPIEWNFPSITKGTLISMLLRKNLFIYDIIQKFDLDSVYPLQDYPVRTETKVKLVSWCADFQHRHYPEFFSAAQSAGRNTRTKLALKNTNDLVLSSHDALTDLRNFYRVRDTMNLHVYHFVSVIDAGTDQNINDLKIKYGLPDKYFMVSNQFHKHKNHKVLLVALAKLKVKGIIKHMAFTGKLPDSADSTYLTDLHRIIDDYDLNSQISMLGVISRNDQLPLMKNSQAVIQPSLFEGWSTVIEDAISLQVPVISSNLRVNIEQLGDKGVYFDPHNPDQLVDLLVNFPERCLNDKFYEEYNTRVRNAAYSLLKILK